PLCIECRKAIEPGATKCTECDSFQDWRRHFTIGHVVLSLLVALVSVLTAAVPVWRTLWARPQLALSLTRCERQSITAYIFNTGQATGVVSKLTLRVPGWEDWQDTPLTPKDVTGIVVRPHDGGSYILEDPSQTNLPHRSIQRCTSYQVSLYLANMDATWFGRASVRTAPAAQASCACPE